MAEPASEVTYLLHLFVRAIENEANQLKEAGAFGFHWGSRGISQRASGGDRVGRRIFRLVQVGANNRSKLRQEMGHNASYPEGLRKC